MARTARHQLVPIGTRVAFRYHQRQTGRVVAHGNVTEDKAYLAPLPSPVDDREVWYICIRWDQGNYPDLPLEPVVGRARERGGNALRAPYAFWEARWPQDVVPLADDDDQVPL